MHVVAWDPRGRAFAHVRVEIREGGGDGVSDSEIRDSEVGKDRDIRTALKAKLEARALQRETVYVARLARTAWNRTRPRRNK